MEKHDIFIPEWIRHIEDVMHRNGMNHDSVIIEMSSAFVSLLMIVKNNPHTLKTFWDCQEGSKQFRSHFNLSSEIAKPLLDLSEEYLSVWRKNYENEI